MKYFVLLGHQNPGSFNHAITSCILKTLQKLEHNAFYHDLYAENFDPVVPHAEIADESRLPESVRKQMQELKESDGIIIVHPNWWGTPPAILKGWVDRVLRNGFAYKFGPNGPEQYFTEKDIQIFSTSNTPRDVELNVYGDPLENFWKVVVFGLCGCRTFERRNFESVIMSSHEDRVAWLDEVRQTIERRFSK
ncbi:MAG: NAD(P)H-dependent oxidoreductase [Planctomycetaceae bacterium]|nr:NAD(P)H-dependent oxidoreductase [Planctomycetaceae bacterium]